MNLLRPAGQPKVRQLLALVAEANTKFEAIFEEKPLGRLRYSDAHPAFNEVMEFDLSIDMLGSPYPA